MLSVCLSQGQAGKIPRDQYRCPGDVENIRGRKVYQTCRVDTNMEGTLKDGVFFSFELDDVKNKQKLVSKINIDLL